MKPPLGNACAASRTPADSQPARRPRRRIGGFTLIEVLTTTSVLVIFLAAVFTGSSQLMMMLASQKQTFNANQCIQERVEQLRGTAWSQITDQTYVQNSVLNTVTVGAGFLLSPMETVTISAFPPDASTSIQLTRQNGAVTLGSGSTTMSSNSAVRVDYQVTWLTRASRQRVRQVSFIVAKGGINN